MRHGIFGKFRSAIGSLSLLALLSSGDLLAGASGAMKPIVAYQGATLIDGTGADPVQNATVLLQGSKILAAGADIEVPEGASVVDVSGRWVVPGLIDAHIHFMTSGRIYTRPAMMDLRHIVPYEDEIKWVESHVPDTLRSFLCAGVTGALSMGGPSIEYSARDQAEKMTDAPSVFNSHGPAVAVPNFLAERLFPRWNGELTLKSLTSPEDAIAFAREAAANNASMVKTAVDDRGSMLFRLILDWLGWEEIHEALIAEAAKYGLKVTSHVHTLEYGRRLMELGVDSLQHLPSDQPVDEKFLSLARAKDVIIVPTMALHKRTFEELYTKEFELLAIEESCSIPGVIQSWHEPLPPSKDDADYLGSRREMVASNTLALYEAGVSLAVGTDAGLMGLSHGASMHLELKRMNEAGIPARDLIVAATLNSAKVAGKDDLYGSVEAGKFADFLILSKNPLNKIENLQALETVVKHGKAFDQQDLMPSLPAE
ncbi:amidohydrolase family protein [Pseudomaricurvus alkylphenolicus]|nr:amidohydrolase family protein [Pseudomaricurvus alkylphenolicus]